MMAFIKHKRLFKSRKIKRKKDAIIKDSGLASYETKELIYFGKMCFQILKEVIKVH